MVQNAFLHQIFGTLATYPIKLLTPLPEQIVESAVAELVNALIQNEYNGGVVSGPFTIGGNIAVELCSKVQKILQ